MRARPPSVPDDASWNEADREWERGERRGALNVGAWTWWRGDGSLESLFVSGEAKLHTLYARAGLFDPVACDATSLGGELHKLLPGMSLELLAPFLASMGGRTPRSMVKGLKYICPALVGGAIHRVEVTDRRGAASIAIVPREAFDGIALAVDHGAAALSPRA